MLNIPTKVDGLDTFSAAEFNSINNELKNTIESSGQTMAGGDLFQIAKASAVYGGAGNFYDETGSVNNYVLSPTTTLKGVDSYKNGLEVRWITSTENTGPTTINVNSLGVKDLVSSTGFPLTAGSLPLGKYVIARYDLANDRFVVEKFIELTSANTGRNLIINGDFSIWQRATSQTVAGYGSVDRFRQFATGSTFSVTRESFALGQTNVPNNPKYFYRNVVTSVAGAANLIAAEFHLEDVNKFSGKEVTLSFWAKADASKNMATSFLQSFGGGGSPSPAVSAIDPATHSLTTSWQKFTTTATIPSTSGKTLGTNNNDLLAITFWFDAGSNQDASTNSLGQQSGTFDIANVQLEFGDTATEFEYVHPADQLARCQRYYQRSNGQEIDHPMTHYNSQGRYAWFDFSNTMRAAPSVVISNTRLFENGAEITGTIVATLVNTTRTNGFALQFNNTVTTNQGGAALAYLEWTADAEI